MPPKHFTGHRKIRDELWGNEQILIVDDDKTNLELLKKHLTEAGYKTLVAENGLQALDLLYECKPAIIICDWLMPKLDGVELCRAVNSLKEDYFIYFIMLTIQSEKNQLMEAFEAGVDDFLRKPFDKDELMARVTVGTRIAGLCSKLNEQIVKIHRLNDELNGLNSKLQKTAITDNLTGLANRGQGTLKLRELWDTAKRYGKVFSCAMVDIDHFKNINDAYGHLAGDNVLRQVSTVLAQSVRQVDHIYRVGGEEFLIVFPDLTAQEANICARRCKEVMESKRFLAQQKDQVITISIGVSEYDKSMTKPDDLLRLADKMLYIAKKEGRNRVVTVAANLEEAAKS